ncbi:hypothetical protein QVH35_00670 [Candidatus Nitrosotenuis chungbukensis]|uniref:hypothetical protein n=1 Tax=Candidatus Nitrosotenuis chungbukensis TaxID=1353246 RepID=UPI0015A53ED4|nr:hypothetical protein [Candidatus Nitrosotenuis chungbukensis]WKT58082.1 hypothetical protein QVH35_00670 [Candidatus Nitrosotenuis chungbukensis]
MLKAVEKCSVCKGPIVQKYMPMKSWNVDGILCSACYSKKLGEYYPGEHVRVNTDKE